MTTLLNKHISFFSLKLPLGKVLLLSLFFAAVLFTRFYNLDQTARFTQDESTDLVRMKQYYDERKITLVGPISTDNIKVFSSATYYMVMPFAAAVGFKPIGPVLGTAFWGVVTALLLLWLTYKKFPEHVLVGGIVIVAWYPLVEMSRWAWNPHFVVFWTALGLVAWEYRSRFSRVSATVTGVALGMLLHHHYIALFATAPFVAWLSIEQLRKKERVTATLLVLGYLFPILPFLLFDLRHPPGLFITHYLLGATPHVEAQQSFSTLLGNLWRNYRVFVESITIAPVIQTVLLFTIPLQVLADMQAKKLRHALWIVPAVSLIIVGVVLDDFFPRYIYPSFGFLFVWLLLPRNTQLSSILSQLTLYCVVLGSLLSLWGQLTITKVEPDIYSFTKATEYIARTITDNSVKNANVAAVAGLDPAPLAEKYRDVIRMHGAPLREASEYDVSENLFVVSTNTEQLVRTDESYSMQVFNSAKLVSEYSIPNSDWKVYWYAF